MPKVVPLYPTRNGFASGESASAEKESNRLSSTDWSKPLPTSADEVEIGTGYTTREMVGDLENPTFVDVEYTPEVSCTTMEDAAKIIAGIKWLLKGWLPYGMVTGIFGEPGKGKSAFALWLARTLTTGSPWFNGMPGPEPGPVLWCGTEGDLAITIDRMQKWKVPFDKIILPYDPLTPVMLDESGITYIENCIIRKKPRAVFIDSLSGGHEVNENDAMKVGKVVQGLGRVAQKSKAAILVVHHSRKLREDEELSSNCTRGSNAIIQHFRVHIGVDRPGGEHDPWSRVRMFNKNLPVDKKPLGFRWADDSSGLVFGDAPHAPVKEKKESGKDKAVAWLKERMKPGEEYPAKEIIDEAVALGFSHTGTLQRAKDELKVETRKVGKTHQWIRNQADPSVIGNTLIS